MLGLIISKRRVINALAKKCGILALLSLFLNFAGCSIKSEKDSIYIDPSRSNEGLLSEIVDSVFYIPLETQEGNIIGNISEIRMYDNKIYILDNSFGTGFFMFDLNGNFLKSYNKRGRGPGEFNRLTAIAVNPETKYCTLFDRGNKKIIELDQDLNFIGERSWEAWISTAYYLGGNELIAPVGPNSDYVVKVFNTEGEELHKYFPYQGNDGDTRFELAEMFTQTNGVFYISKLFCDTLFAYKEGSLVPVEIFKYSNHGIPSDLMKLNNTELGVYLDEHGSDFAYSHNLYLDSDDKMILVYQIQGAFRMAVYFKNEGRIKSYNGFTNDIDGGLFRFPAKTNMPDALISIIHPFELKELDNKNEVSEISGSLKHLIDKIKFDGNPVLMVMKLKGNEL